jgi:MFS family permease
MTGVGWLHTFEGRVGICVALIILGAIVTVVLSVIRFVLHKQTAREFGGGMLILGAIFMGPALLTLIAVTSVELFHRAPVWVWPLAVAGIIGTLGARFVLGRKGKDEPQPAALPMSPALAEPGWSMPADEPQWDR